MATTLIITNDFPPRRGGIESFVSRVCDLLDHDVVVLTSGPPGAAGDDRRRPYPVIRRGSVLLPTAAVGRLAVQTMVEHGSRRVLFGAAAPLGLLAGRLRRTGATRIVGLTHGHECWWAAVPGARSLLRRIGDACDHLTTISAHTTARITPALSPEARTRLRRLAPPVGSDFLPARPDPTSGTRRCIAVGRFVAQKGLPTLVAAWRLVLDHTGPGSELVLVGDGPQRSRLERLVAQLGLHPSVRFTGSIDPTDVAAELARSHVFALPVRTRLAGLYAEGLGLAALEAAACGLPVIVGDSGGAPETVQDRVTGFVVQSGDASALAARIIDLFEDRERAADMGRRGRAFVTAQFGAAAVRTQLRYLLDLD